MAEVANGVTGQYQSFDVLRNNHHHEDHEYHDYHDEDYDEDHDYHDYPDEDYDEDNDYLYISNDDENLVVSHIGWMPCIAFDRFTQI